MLVSTLINSSARKCGIVASGASVTSDESTDILEAMQIMLRSWAAEKVNVFHSVSETFTLAAGTATYTWGVGGAISTLRPNGLIGASILSSGVTYGVDILSETEYRRITTKTTGGRPYGIFVDYGFPYVTIKLYPAPDAADTLVLDSLKPFTEASSFSAGSDTLQMPMYYEEAIVYNLAIRIAPEFGKTITRDVARIADTSWARISNKNAANYIEPVKIVLPVNPSGRYSINAGI